MYDPIAFRIPESVDDASHIVATDLEVTLPEGITTRDWVPQRADAWGISQPGVKGAYDLMEG